MKVLLLNGSPHPNGCTYTALEEVGGVLRSQGIATEIFQLGTQPVMGCLGCGKCRELGHCIYNNDGVNKCAEIMQHCHGLVVGTPVYYAGPNGALCAFLDRLFYSSSRVMANKVAACVVNCRRGGASASFDRLNKYFTISNMHVVSSQYWNSTHGFTPEDVRKDLEGLQTMRTLGANMAWLLRCIEAGDVPPVPEEHVMTNFIS